MDSECHHGRYFCAWEFLGYVIIKFSTGPPARRKLSLNSAFVIDDPAPPFSASLTAFMRKYLQIAFGAAVTFKCRSASVSDRYARRVFLLRLLSLVTGFEEFLFTI